MSLPSVNAVVAASVDGKFAKLRSNYSVYQSFFGAAPDDEYFIEGDYVYIREVETGDYFAYDENMASYIMVAGGWAMIDDGYIPEE